MATTRANVRTSVRGLGEIALSINNLDAMRKFYEEVIGLTRNRSRFVFDRISLDGLARASARVQDVDLALFPLDRIEQAVEVVEIGRVVAHAGHVPANQLDGLIERLLPPAGDENVGAFFDKQLAARQPHAAR